MAKSNAAQKPIKAKKKEESQKFNQKHSQNFFGITVLKNSHPSIKKIKRSEPLPEIHGNKFWSSSGLLMDFLEIDPPEKGSTVMEIGCGWALASIYCALKHQASVTAVDADPNVFPYLDLHTQLNQVSLTKKSKRFEKLNQKDLSGHHLMIGSDICFWDELNPILYKLIKRGIKAGLTRVVIADPGRQPFLDLADKCEKKFGADLYEWDLKKPVKATGYVLEINVTLHQ